MGCMYVCYFFAVASCWQFSANIHFFHNVSSWATSNQSGNITPIFYSELKELSEKIFFFDFEPKKGSLGGINRNDLHILAKFFAIGFFSGAISQHPRT